MKTPSQPQDSNIENKNPSGTFSDGQEKPYPFPNKPRSLRWDDEDADDEDRSAW